MIVMKIVNIEIIFDLCDCCACRMKAIAEIVAVIYITIVIVATISIVAIIAIVVIIAIIVTNNFI